MNELKTLMAAVVVAKGTCPATTRAIPTYEQAWAGEQELWMVCSTMSAPLAAKRMMFELKEATARQRLELFESGLKSGTATSPSVVVAVPESREAEGWRRCPVRQAVPSSRSADP